jgi:hypothetical protein
MLEDVMYGQKERRVGECVSLPAGQRCWRREIGIDDVHVGGQACLQAGVPSSSCADYSMSPGIV